MTLEQRIERLERLNATLRARNDLMFITLLALLSGELCDSLIATRTESLIATVLNTDAPDEIAEALASDGGKFRAALAAFFRNRATSQP